jgi:hypothetical protein
MPRPDLYSKVAQDGTESPQTTAARLLEVYAIAIDANVSGDQETVRHALALLKKTLQPEVNPILASQLAELYATAEAALEEDRHDWVAEILETLRGFWTARLRIDHLENNSTFP